MLLRLSFLSASEADVLAEYVLALAKAAEKRAGFYFFFTLLVCSDGLLGG